LEVAALSAVALATLDDRVAVPAEAVVVRGDDMVTSAEFVVTTVMAGSSGLDEVTVVVGGVKTKSGPKV